MKNIRITQIDGALPNLALMKLSSWHKDIGDRVVFTRHIKQQSDEPENYDVVYGSAIFKFSQKRIQEFRTSWPNSILGGTGTESAVTVEQIIGDDLYIGYSYDGTDVDYSLGFTQRGCRLKCKFCVVPGKEGKNRSEATVSSIYRGAPWPKKIHLLDNDFFGQPRDQWEARIDEIINGKFRVCLSQGINVRLINDEAAAALARVEYRNTKFDRRRLYTAWDNLGDERVFFRGVEMLAKHGIPPAQLMAYMLVGFDKRETWPDIWHRFGRMVELGIMPYPMVYDRSRKDLCAFQRYANLGLYRIFSWVDFENPWKPPESLPGSYTPHRTPETGE